MIELAIAYAAAHGNTEEAKNDAATNSADAIDSYEAVIGNAIEYAIEAEREEEYSE